MLSPVTAMNTGAGCTAALLTLTASAGVPSAEVVLYEGQEITGTPGVAVTTINPPFTDADGRLGLNAALSSGERVIVYDGAVIFNSSESSVPLTGAESNTGVGAGGRFIYSPSIDGNDGVYGDSGIIAYDTQDAPGFPGQYLSFCSRPQMFGTTSYFIAGVSASPGGATAFRVLYRGGDETIEPVLAAGDMIGGLTIDQGSGIDFDYCLSNDNLHHIAVLTMVEPPTSSDVIVAIDGELVLQEGDPTGDGDNWTAFDIPAINNAGDWLITGDTDGDSTTDEFVAINGVIAVREGDVIDDFTITSSATLRAASLSDGGRVAHVWSMPSAVEAAFIGFACDLAATSRVVLVTGDLLDLDGDGKPDAEVLDINSSPIAGPSVDIADDGAFYIEVELSDVGTGSPGDAIIRLAIGGGADVDGDGTVGVGDLLAVLAAWGPCTGCPCVEDVDGDGSVAVGDLLAILAAWD